MSLKLTSLPMEVIDNVFEYISEIEDDSIAVTTLLNLKLCKVLRLSSNHALYLDPTRAHTRWNWKKASQLRDILKSQPAVAKGVKRLSRLATYHAKACTLKRPDVAGKWVYEIVKGCKNVASIEIPSRLQGSVLLTVELLNSLSKLRHLVIRPPKSVVYEDEFRVDAHELLCSLRFTSPPLSSLSIATFSRNGGRPDDSACTVDEASAIDFRHFAFETDDFVEDAWTHFFPAEMVGLRSLTLQGYFIHAIDHERYETLEELAATVCSTLETLIVRPPPVTLNRYADELDEYGSYHSEMCPYQDFDPAALFEESIFPKLRSLTLQGICFFTLAHLSMIVEQCQELRSIVLANSVWDVQEWSNPEEACTSICRALLDLSDLVTVHLGDLPVETHDSALLLLVRYCEEHDIDLEFRTCIDGENHPTPPSPYPTSPSSSTVTSIGSSDSQDSDAFFCYPFYRNSPFSDASSNNSYTSSMFWTETESTPSEYDSYEPMFDDPSYHAPLSPRSPSSRSPLYLPSSPDIPRLEDGYEAHDPDGDESPTDYPTDDEAEEEVAQDKFYESWYEL
ncbi:hypothetical protein JCM5353_008020 [Sporobolomyces roseus]